jgi:DNA-binding winged helix-turn-helix (wHTH) protein
LPELLIDQSRQCARINGQEIYLSPQEYRLVYRLGQQVGQVVSKTELLAAMWLTEGGGREGAVGFDPMAVDLVVFRLRRKLQDNAQRPLYLETRRGFGYILHHARILSRSANGAAQPSTEQPLPAAAATPAPWLAGPWATLTRCEWRIFLLLGDEATTGLTNRALAQQLQIGEGTLKKHLQHIYRKLGVSNRSAAALLSLQVKVQLQINP